MGQRAIVDIGAGDDSRRRDRLLRFSPLDRERRPIGNLPVILTVLHAVVAMMRRHLAMALPQEGDILVVPDETDVRARMNERLGLGDRTLRDEIRPELA